MAESTYMIGRTIYHDDKPAHSVERATNPEQQTNFSWCDRCGGWYRPAGSTGLKTFDDAVSTLRELVDDVEVAGIEDIRAEWPDLVVTYVRAKEVLRDLGEYDKG